MERWHRLPSEVFPKMSIVDKKAAFAFYRVFDKKVKQQVEEMKEK